MAEIIEAKKKLGHFSTRQFAQLIEKNAGDHQEPEEAGKQGEIHVPRKEETDDKVELVFQSKDEMQLAEPQRRFCLDLVSRRRAILIQ